MLTPEFWCGLFLGLLVGACAGMIVMAMCVAAGRAEDVEEEIKTCMSDCNQCTRDCKNPTFPEQKAKP